MKTLASLCIALAVSAAPFAVHAAGAERTKQYEVCMNKSDASTQSMVECVDAEFKRQDARLNAAYKALMAGLTPERQTQLLETQRIWIKFRDANCRFYVDPDGGTITRIDASLCMVSTSAHRASELEQFGKHP